MELLTPAILPNRRAEPPYCIARRSASRRAFLVPAPITASPRPATPPSVFFTGQLAGQILCGNGSAVSRAGPLPLATAVARRAAAALSPEAIVAAVMPTVAAPLLQACTLPVVGESTRREIGRWNVGNVGQEPTTSIVPHQRGRDWPHQSRASVPALSVLRPPWASPLVPSHATDPTWASVLGAGANAGLETSDGTELPSSWHMPAHHRISVNGVS